MLCLCMCTYKTYLQMFYKALLNVYKTSRCMSVKCHQNTCFFFCLFTSPFEFQMLKLKTCRKYDFKHF